MKPEEIVALIKRRNAELIADDKEGVTQSSIADKLGLRQSAVNQVVHKNQASEKIKVAVYDVVKRYTDEPFEKFWDRKDR